MTSDLAVIRRDWAAPILHELRSQVTTLADPAPWLYEALGAMRTQAGVFVSERTAFQVAPLVTCVTFLATKISACPHRVYNRDLNKHGRQVDRIAYDHPRYELVSVQPNDEMTARTFLLAFCVHMLAWPAAYAEIQRDGGVNATALWPRDPGQTRPFRATAPLYLRPEPWRPFPWVIEAGELAYETTDGNGYRDGAPDHTRRVIRKEDMLCVPGMTFDGRLGVSIVTLAREVLAHYLATQHFGARYFANYARPGGILTIPNMRDKKDAKDSWVEAHSGSNINGTAVLPQGYEFKPYTDDPTKAQSLEALRYLRSTICALYHLAPRFAGDTSVTARANAEQEALEVIDACNPWMVAIEQEWKAKLFPRSYRGVPDPHLTKFDTWAMRHPDAATREKFYKTHRSLGALNANEQRAYEGLNPIEESWAEDYWMPTNMTLTTTPVDPTTQRLLADTKLDPATQE